MTESGDHAARRSDVTRLRLSAELAAVRAEFHDLHAAVGPAEWRLRPAGSDWTVHQIMYHLAMGHTFVAAGLTWARSGRGFTPSTKLGNRINNHFTRYGSVWATDRMILRKFDRGHDRLVAILESVSPDEWDSRGVQNFRGFETVESSFELIRAHFDEHAADVRSALAQN